MEKILFAPEAEVVRFPSQDIVTTSGEGPGNTLPDDIWE
jgi:hypothetical protein